MITDDEADKAFETAQYVIGKTIEYLRDRPVTDPAKAFNEVYTAILNKLKE
jgi:hypothetical protein